MRTKNMDMCFHSQENNEMSSLSVWNTSPYLLIKQEKLVYTVESLVAEFGGTLGLFLGFSFIAIWDKMVFLRIAFLEINSNAQT